MVEDGEGLAGTFEDGVAQVAEIGALADIAFVEIEGIVLVAGAFLGRDAHVDVDLLGIGKQILASVELGVGIDALGGLGRKRGSGDQCRENAWNDEAVHGGSFARDTRGTPDSFAYG
jgi:hypothetical protein